MSEMLPLLTLQVAQVVQLNPLIRQIRLRAADGSALPGYTAGAHLRVRVQLPGGSEDWRHYSLVNLSADVRATDAPREYVIAVRREDAGRGGSRFMHEQVKEGQLLTIEAPKNEFALRPHAGCAVLIAGGIGVTPLASMAAQRVRDKAGVRMHYAGRTRDTMAFVQELERLLGDALLVHSDAEAGGPLDIEALLERCGANDELYVCGPKVMLDAVLALTQARGWNHDRVHFELFTTPATEAGDQAIEVLLAQSGQTLTVPAGMTILDCLIEHGCDPMFDCRRGECGVCSTPVIEGDIDHRDYFLSKDEKASGKVMQICVSRARGNRLVLDI